LNALTGAGALAEDKLFATLDTRARRLALPDHSYAVVTDTVGFIRKMPKDLFAAFRATFEEIADADLILEVIDASSEEREEHAKTTADLLTELELSQIPRLVVYNKVDRLSEEERDRLDREPESIAVSATSPEPVKRLLDRIGTVLSRMPREVPVESYDEPEPSSSGELAPVDA
jgi:GTP-binding protein HflX